MKRQNPSVHAVTSLPKEIHMYQPAPDLDEDDINLGDLIGVLLENRWLILAVMLVAFVIGSFKAFTAVPVYRADGLLQVEEQSSGMANLESSSMFQDYVPVAAEIEILRSRSVLGAVVDNLKLDINAYPEYMPYIGEALARRKPPEERPSIKVDTLDVPDNMRGHSMKLVADSDTEFSVYRSNDEFLLRGRVGEYGVGHGPVDGTLGAHRNRGVPPGPSLCLVRGAEGGDVDPTDVLQVNLA